MGLLLEVSCLLWKVSNVIWSGILRPETPLQYRLGSISSAALLTLHVFQLRICCLPFHCSPINFLKQNLHYFLSFAKVDRSGRVNFEFCQEFNCRNGLLITTVWVMYCVLWLRRPHARAVLSLKQILLCLEETACEDETVKEHFTHWWSCMWSIWRALQNSPGTANKILGILKNTYIITNTYPQFLWSTIISDENVAR